EITKGREISQKPGRILANREEALDWYLKISGLIGQKGVDRSAEIGIVENSGQYQLAADQRLFGSAALGVSKILAEVRCPLTLATGQNDPIARQEDFADAGLPVSVIEGAGHQVQLEAAEQVWQLFTNSAQTL